MTPFKAKRRKKKSHKNKIAVTILIIIVGLLVNNAIMSHDNKEQQIENLKEVE